MDNGTTEKVLRLERDYSLFATIPISFLSLVHRKTKTTLKQDAIRVVEVIKTAVSHELPPQIKYDETRKLDIFFQLVSF